MKNKPNKPVQHIEQSPSQDKCVARVVKMIFGPVTLWTAFLLTAVFTFIEVWTEMNYRNPCDS